MSRSLPPQALSAHEAGATEYSQSAGNPNVKTATLVAPCMCSRPVVRTYQQKIPYRRGWASGSIKPPQHPPMGPLARDAATAAPECPGLG